MQTPPLLAFELVPSAPPAEGHAPPAVEPPDLLSIAALVLALVGPVVAWGLADSKSKGRALATEAHHAEKIGEVKADLAASKAQTAAVDERVRSLETTMAATTPKLDALTRTLESKADALAVASVGKSVDQLREDINSRFGRMEDLVRASIRDNVPKGRTRS